MALPIFLRPLLLIEYYWQTLVYTLNRWLQRSNEELFGPLEQIIVAVVITGIAMNPAIITNLGGQAPPMAVPYPMAVMPPAILPPQAAAPPIPSAPPPDPPTGNSNNAASPSLPNSTTSNGTRPAIDSANTGFPWIDVVIDLIPPEYRPNPITVALGIMLLNLLWHIIPRDLLHRLRESWRVFWPPWQERSARPSSSTETSPSRNEKPKSRDPSSDDQTKEKVRASSATKDGSKAEAEAKVGDADKEKERAKRKALAEYQAKKEAAKKEAGAEGEEQKEIPPVPPAAKDPEKLEKPRSRSEAAPTAKGPPDEVKPANTADQETPSTDKSADEDDPLMAGDYRPLRSILKQSKKKPRQSKNVHHHYFMGMRGHQAHLIPFPHGLHPPPHEPRHTMWWRNIPKDASHMMAPPPPPKEVKEEKDEDDGKASEKDTTKEAAKPADDDKGKDKDKDQGKGKEKVGKGEEIEKERSKPTESEAAVKVKERAAEKNEGKATATAEIVPPSEPDIPVDPQVQKATRASQAMLCLLLFSIQQQLGLILLAFFVWTQLNSHAAAQERRHRNQPIAVATAQSEAPPPPPAKKEEVMPPEMREKLDRSEAKAKAEEGIERSPEKGKEKEATPKAEEGKEMAEERTKRKLAAMSPEERKKYERYMAQKQAKESAGQVKQERIKQREETPEERMKRKMKAMSPDEREKYEKYMAQKQKKADEEDGGAVARDKGKEKEKEEERVESPDERLKRKLATMTPEERQKYERYMAKKRAAIADGDKGNDEAGKRDTGKQREETPEERMKRKIKAMTPDQRAEYERYLKQKRETGVQQDGAKTASSASRPPEKEKQEPRALTKEEKEAYYRAKKEKDRGSNAKPRKVTIEDVTDEQAGGSGLTADEKAAL